MLAPNGDRGTMQACVNALMITARDLPSDPALQLAQRHPRRMRGLVSCPLGRVTEGRAREKVHCPHLCADQPLDVTAKMGLPDGAPDHPDPIVTARPLKGPTPKIRPVVSVQCLRQAGDWPGNFDLPLGYPGGLIVHCMQKAQANG